jgi:hypothetical protein
MQRRAVRAPRSAWYVDPWVHAFYGRFERELLDSFENALYGSYADENQAVQECTRMGIDWLETADEEPKARVSWMEVPMDKIGRPLAVIAETGVLVTLGTKLDGTAFHLRLWKKGSDGKDFWYPDAGQMVEHVQQLGDLAAKELGKRRK